MVAHQGRHGVLASPLERTSMSSFLGRMAGLEELPTGTLSMSSASASLGVLSPLHHTPSTAGLAMGAEMTLAPAREGQAELPQLPSHAYSSAPSLLVHSQGCLPQLGLSLLGLVSSRVCHGVQPRGLVAERLPLS